MKEKDDPLGLPGPYDADSIPEEDLWFLPGAAALDPAVPPGPVADHRPLLRPKAWAQAEAGQAGQLACAALVFGALEDRVRQQPGLAHRLALSEVADQSWHLGPRIAPDRLALYLAAAAGFDASKGPAWIDRQAVDEPWKLGADGWSSFSTDGRLHAGWIARSLAVRSAAEEIARKQAAGEALQP